MAFGGILYYSILEFAWVNIISSGEVNSLILGGNSKVKTFFCSKLTLSHESMGIKLDLEPK